MMMLAADLCAITAGRYLHCIWYQCVDFSTVRFSELACKRLDFGRCVVIVSSTCSWKAGAPVARVLIGWRASGGEAWCMAATSCHFCRMACRMIANGQQHEKVFQLISVCSREKATMDHG